MPAQTAQPGVYIEDISGGVRVLNEVQNVVKPSQREGARSWPKLS